MAATQTKYPWRATARTIFQAAVGLAVLAPVIYPAAAQRDPAEAGGWVGVALVISAAITRVMAIPGVNEFLQKYVPFLAAEPQPAVERPDGAYDVTGGDL